FVSNTRLPVWRHYWLHFCLMGTDPTIHYGSNLRCKASQCLARACHFQEGRAFSYLCYLVCMCMPNGVAGYGCVSQYACIRSQAHGLLVSQDAFEDGDG